MTKYIICLLLTAEEARRPRLAYRICLHARFPITRSSLESRCDALFACCMLVQHSCWPCTRLMLYNNIRAKSFLSIAQTIIYQVKLLASQWCNIVLARGCAPAYYIHVWNGVMSSWTCVQPVCVSVCARSHGDIGQSWMSCLDHLEVAHPLAYITAVHNPRGCVCVCVSFHRCVRQIGFSICNWTN